MPAGHDISGGDVALREIQIKVIDDATVLTTGDGKTSFVVTKLLSGMRLAEAQAAVVGTSSSGTPTVQIRRVRAGSPVDMLSTAITIDVSETDSYTADAPSSVNAANDDLLLSDRIFIDVDVAGTGTDGLDVILTFAAAQVAAPAYVTASAGTTDAGGAWSHSSAAPGAAGRLIICQVLQDGTSANNAITIDSATNCTNIAGTSNVFTALAATGFDVGSAAAGYQYLFLARSTGTSAIAITGGNSGTNDIYVRTYEFQNVNTGTALTDILENTTAGSVTSGAGTGTTISDSAVVTTGVDRLALNFCALTDDATGLAAFGGETGGDWTLATAIYETGTGTDGCIALMQAAMATAGTIDGGTDTITSLPWGVIGFALIGTTVASTFIPRLVTY